MKLVFDQARRVLVAPPTFVPEDLAQSAFVNESDLLVEMVSRVILFLEAIPADRTYRVRAKSASGIAGVAPHMLLAMTGATYRLWCVPHQTGSAGHEETTPMTTRDEASEMRPLRYSINVTLDGCCDHRAIPADEDLHRHHTENLDRADALLFGRVMYEMMEEAWRPPAPTGSRPDWMEPFAQTINAVKKYVVSSALERVDWNAELVRGDLGKAVQQLKQESGKGLFVSGVKLPLALAELGLIDEYEFVVHPRLAGHGPALFSGLSKYVDLKLVSRLEFPSGAVAMRYEPRR